MISQLVIRGIIMDHNRLITQPVISDNATGYHHYHTNMVDEYEDDEDGGG